MFGPAPEPVAQTADPAPAVPREPEPRAVPPVQRIVAGHVPAPSGRTGKYETVLFLPDIHCGDQDDRAVSLALEVIKHIQPDRIIQLGDALDFYGLSRFDTNPQAFAFHVQEELDIQHAIYDLICTAAPKAVKQQVLGNHEERGRRLLWRNPSLMGLRAMSLESLMRLDELGWDPTIYESILLAGGTLVVQHGTYARQHAGASAMAEQRRAGLSGCTGHTHRLAMIPLTNQSGEYVWCEAGTLQNNPPRWRSQVQDWQQGLVIGEVEADGNAFSLTPIRFRRSYRCRLGGKELEG